MFPGRYMTLARPVLLSCIQNSLYIRLRERGTSAKVFDRVPKAAPSPMKDSSSLNPLHYAEILKKPCQTRPPEWSRDTSRAARRSGEI